MRVFQLTALDPKESITKLAKKTFQDKDLQRRLLGHQLLAAQHAVPQTYQPPEQRRRRRYPTIQEEEKSTQTTTTTTPPRGVEIPAETEPEATSTATQTQEAFSKVIGRYADLVEAIFERLASLGIAWHPTTGVVRGNPHVNVIQVVETLAAQLLSSSHRPTLQLTSLIWKRVVPEPEPAEEELTEEEESLSRRALIARLQQKFQQGEPRAHRRRRHLTYSTAGPFPQ
jgi:hypothetical protein